MNSAHSMTAVVRTSFERHGLTISQVEPPECGEDQLILEVEYCGLCGSDLHIWRGDDGYEWVPTGTVLGHEVVGRVVEVGTGAVDAGFGLGDRVVPIAQTGCNTCEACLRDYANGCSEKRTLGLSRRGGATQRVAVEANDVLRIPEGLPARTAVLAEPASIAARAVSTRGGVVSSDRVVVSGPGAVGQLCALIAQHIGAEVILLGTERDVATRTDSLARMGLTVSASIPDDYKPTVWIEASGAAPALAAGLEALPVQGKLIIVALYGAPPMVPLNLGIRKELDVVLSYSSFRADFELAITVLAEHPTLGESFVEVYPIDDALAAFDAIGQGAAAKVAIHMT